MLIDPWHSFDGTRYLIRDCANPLGDVLYGDALLAKKRDLLPEWIVITA